MVGNSGKNFASIYRTLEENILKAFLVLRVTMLVHFAKRRPFCHMALLNFKSFLFAIKNGVGLC